LCICFLLFFGARMLQHSRAETGGHCADALGRFATMSCIKPRSVRLHAAHGSAKLHRKLIRCRFVCHWPAPAWPHLHLVTCTRVTMQLPACTTAKPVSVQWQLGHNQACHMVRTVWR
jgi:hypothetical protein